MVRHLHARVHQKKHAQQIEIQVDRDGILHTLEQEPYPNRHDDDSRKEHGKIGTRGTQRKCFTHPIGHITEEEEDKDEGRGDQRGLQHVAQKKIRYAEDQHGERQRRQQNANGIGKSQFIEVEQIQLQDRLNGEQERRKQSPLENCKNFFHARVFRIRSHNSRTAP